MQMHLSALQDRRVERRGGLKRKALMTVKIRAERRAGNSAGERKG